MVLQVLPRVLRGTSGTSSVTAGSVICGTEDGGLEVREDGGNGVTGDGGDGAGDTTGDNGVKRAGPGAKPAVIVGAIRAQFESSHEVIKLIRIVSIFSRIIVDYCSWPNIQLSEIHHLLALTTTPPTDNFYECYFPKLQEWVQVSVVDSVPIDTNANTLLVRWVGVVGHDEVKHMGVYSARGREKARAVERIGLKREVIEISDDDYDEDSCPTKRLCLPPLASSPNFPSSIRLPSRLRSMSTSP
ncbi:hypothetical protein K438DRAFT_1995737 [Mycena galopus ATCC 62051]|nr:hypothetical protein K438DRAFT_1995737 [Mycena galopus ATCC 62051]